MEASETPEIADRPQLESNIAEQSRIRRSDRIPDADFLDKLHPLDVSDAFYRPFWGQTPRAVFVLERRSLLDSAFLGKNTLFYLDFGDGVSPV